MSSQPREVDFSAIEKELSALWKSAAEAAPAAAGAAGEAAPVMRSCLMNLVVCCNNIAESERAAAMIAEVTRSAPARVLLTVADATASGDSLTATIAAHCSFTPGGGKSSQVCCEQITLSAGGGATGRLPGAVVPLLLPDLPVVLWWPGEPHLSGEADLRLVQSADRLLVDSHRFTRAPSQLEWLSSVDRPIADLTWQRLRGWRELTAGLFDARPFDLYPKRIERILADYIGNGAASAEAILLGTWAAARAGWCAGRHSLGPSYPMARPDGEPAELTLRAISQGRTPSKSPIVRPWMVLGLTIEAQGATFTLSRGAYADTLTASVAMAEACPVPRTARVVERDEATLMSRALESGWRDRIYDEALDLAARLLGPDRVEATP